MPVLAANVLTTNHLMAYAHDLDIYLGSTLFGLFYKSRIVSSQKI